MQTLNAQERILLDIAIGESAEYESEYDGRMYTMCCFCGVDLHHREHTSDCKIFEARSALGNVWQEYLAEKQAERAAATQAATQAYTRKQQQAEQQRISRERVPCSKCGKHVAREGMSAHQASRGCERRQKTAELRAHEERTGIKCITDLYINYTGKRCAQCDKPMPDAHPNARFCSNTGSGNCKDRFNNMRGNRTERARKFSGQQTQQASNWFSNELAWRAGEHKEC